MKNYIISLIFVLLAIPAILFSEQINVALNKDTIKLNFINPSIWVWYGTNFKGEFAIVISKEYYRAISKKDALILTKLSDDEVSKGNYSNSIGGYGYTYDEMDVIAKKYLHHSQIYDGIKINPESGFIAVCSNEFGNANEQQYYFALITTNQFKRLDLRYDGALLQSSPFGEPGCGLFYDKEWNCIFFGAYEITNNYMKKSSGVYRYDISEDKLEKLYDVGVSKRAVSMARLPNTDYLMFSADIEGKDKGDIYLIRAKKPSFSGNSALIGKLHSEGLALYKSHKDTEAVKKYEEALKSGESAELYYDYANSLSNLKDRQEDSVSAYLKAIDLGYPKKELAYYNLACVYSKMSKIPETYDSLKKAVEAGYKQVGYFEKDPDLKNVRADKGWQEFYKGLKK